MKSKSELKISDFHKYIEKTIQYEFGDIEFENGKSIVISVKDETDKVYVYSRGSKEDVTLAICELFHTISKMDRVYFCEIFAEMRDRENAEYLYDSLKRRADMPT